MARALEDFRLTVLLIGLKKDKFHTIVLPAVRLPLILGVGGKVRELQSCIMRKVVN